MLKIIHSSQISIASNRQRKEMDAKQIDELADSINKIGLLHPVVVRDEGGKFTLVAGERRLKAMQFLWGMGLNFKCGSIDMLKPNLVPCLSLGDLAPLDATEAELEENIRRVDLTWQERAEATNKLHDLRCRQAELDGQRYPPTYETIGAEVYPDYVPKAAASNVREDLVLARSLKDPEVAKASSAKDALKIIKRKEQAQRDTALGVSVGKTFSSASHNLIKGDSLEWMAQQPSEQFDCILTDPPYGIDAQDFNDSGGVAPGGHDYDDSKSTWNSLMSAFGYESYRLAKPQAHLYCFCDIENFLELRDKMKFYGWKCFRTPLVWHNPMSQRAPWPQSGPQRKYQICLYALKGSRPVLKLSPDVVTYASDPNLGWSAQKPVGLYQDLLTRSCRAGDSVLDPFAGTGTIFSAAHGMKIKATGIERDDIAYGIAVRRLEELK